MEAKLSVEVGAKVDELKAKMTEAKTSVKDFATSADQSLKTNLNNFKSFNQNYNASANDAIRAERERILAARKARVDAANEAGKIAKQQAEAANQVEGSGIKVGNSLTKAFSGLRTLAYILPGIGIAGIFNLAFDALVPLVQKIDLFNFKLSETEKNAQAAREALKTINSVKLGGEQDAQKELTSLDSLYRASQNQNLSLKERKKAVDELQSQYPKYFKNLSDEEILAGKAGKAYDGLKESIIDAAIARAQGDKISQNASEKLKNTFNDLVKAQAIFRLQREKAALKPTNPQDENEAVRIAATAAQLDSRINTLQKEREDIKRRNNTLDAISLSLKTQIDAVTVKDGTDVLNKDLGKKADSEADAIAKKRQEQIRKLAALRQQQFELGLSEAQRLAQAIDGFYTNNQKSLKAAYAGRPIDLMIEKVKALHEAEILGSRTKPFIDSIDLANADLLLSKVNSLSKTITDNLQGAFQNFFDNIVKNGTISFKTLAENILQDMAKIVTSSVAKKLAQLLTGQISGVSEDGKPKATGILGALGGILGLTSKGGAAAAGATAGTGGLLLPILAGVAGISLLSGIFKKKKTDDYVPPVAQSTVNGQSVSVTGGQEVFFKVRGTDLVAVLNLAGQSLSRYRQGP